MPTMSVLGLNSESREILATSDLQLTSDLALSSSRSTQSDLTTSEAYTPTQEIDMVSLNEELEVEMMKWKDIHAIWLAIADDDADYAGTIVDRILSDLIGYRAYQLAACNMSPSKSEDTDDSH